MKRKKLIISILVGAAVAGATIYLLTTPSGKKELSKLKKTGGLAAGALKTFKKEVERNIKQAQKEERIRMLKAYVQETLVA
ncbi:MAG TPA: hypothetical protein VEY10_12510 [Flavisolibacter sp.]|jgi:gas vesicle protein|nr:hypothetical protein [Flavisolibacter sp.]